MRSEVVHVMLKPDALERGLRDVIVDELVSVAGPFVWARRMKLALDQIEAIYRRFPNPHSKDFVFNYFTSRDTEHLAFVGVSGLHHEVHKIKGNVRLGTGIRGRYFTDYTNYTAADIEAWLRGTSSRASEIDVEMFGRDILHVADNQEDSLAGLRAVMGLRFVEVLGAVV